MRTGSAAIFLERIKILIFIIAIWYSQGASGLSGFGKFYGPLGGCQTRASNVNNGTNNASGITNSDGYFNISVAQTAGGMFRVFIGPNASSCVDTFTGRQPPFQLSAAAPTDNTSVRVGFVSHTALAYLDLGSATSANASTNNTAGLGAGNVTAVRKTLIDLYSALNISLSSYNLDPISLEPLAQLTSPNATTRALGVALLAAEAQLGSLVTLGTALLQSATPTAAAAAAAANRNSTLLSRMVAAEGMQQLLQLEAQRQQELAAAVAAALAAATGAYNGTLVENSTESNVTAPAGLYLSEVVRIVLNASAARANLSLQSYAVNATADVVAGMAQFAEELKSVALREMVGERLGLNPLNAVITLARLTVVQAEAADQMSTLLGSSRDVLQTYVLDALPERLSKAAADITAIHTYLGLPAPTVPGPANGVAHLVGPLGDCEGQASSIWTPDYETLLTTGTGSLQLKAKGSGFVTVSSYRYCQDELTGLRLGLTLSNLGPAAAAVSVSPVGMLAQGFYTVAASQGLATPSQDYQQAAFSAMGLNLTAYNALMIQPLSANASLNSAPSPPAPPPLPPAEYSPPNNISAHPGHTSSGWPFNLSHPLMPAIMSANTQLVGIMYSARALFARSCGVAYGLESEENYNTFTATLVIYALAVQGLDGARLNLSSTNHLSEVFKWLADACYFNSSAEATAAVSTTGSFLSGGGGSAVGTAQSAVAAARSSATSVNTSTGTRTRHVIQQGGQEVAARVTTAAGAGANGGLRHRRRLHADLLSLGVLGPQGLVAGAPRNRDPAQSEYEEDGEGQEAGEEAAELLGLVGAVAAGVVGRVARGRVLTVYVDDSDFKNVYTKVSQILAGINTKLQEVHNASTVAAASPSAAAATNLTDLLVRTSQLGYVLQNGLYVELDTALARNYSQGLQLVTAVGDISNRYTGEALQQRMEEAYFSKLLVCGADGAICGASAPPPPAPANSGGGGKKSNALLYVVAGVAGGVGVLVGVVAGVLTYRAMRNRKVKRTVVNKFATGDMTNLESRMPSTMHVHTLYGGLGGSGPFITPGIGRSVLGPENYVPMVPAALGSDPRVALDYPIFPYRGSVTNNSMAVAAYNAIYNPGQHRNAVSAVIPASAPRQTGLLPTAQTLPASLPSSGLGSAPSPGSRGTQGHPSQQPLQDSQLSQQPYPQQQHPQPPPLAEQLSAAVPSSQSELSNGAMHYGVPLRAASGGGALAGLKLYTNTALVHADHAADASAAFADNGAPVSSAPSAVGGALVHRGTSAAAMSASQLRSAPSAGLLDRRGSRQPLPLAPYTAVSNTAAPTASLSSSMRAIPVNAHFNSSLRPPGAPGASGGPLVPQRRHSNMAQYAGHQREGTASLLDAGGVDLPVGRFHGSGGGAGS